MIRRKAGCRPGKVISTMLKKILPFFLLAMLTFAIFACIAEDVISTEEDLRNVLAEHRRAGDTAFELQLSEELYRNVRSNSFCRFRQLEQLYGISDDSLSYSDMKNVLQLSNIVWGEITATECDTLEDVQSAIASMIEQGKTSFELICDDELFSTLNYSSLIDFYAAKCGVIDLNVRYNSTYKVFFIADLVFGNVMTAECATPEEIEAAVAEFAEFRPDEYRLMCPQELFDQMKVSGMIYFYAAGNGLQDLTVRTGIWSPVFYLSEAVPCETPWAKAGDEQGFRACIEMMKELGADDFCIIFLPDFYSEITADKDQLRIMQASSQMESFSSTRKSNYCRRIEYFGVEYSDAPRIVCETEEDIVDAVRQMGGIGADSFNIILTEALYDTVSEGYFDRLRELETEAGMTESDMKYSLSNYVLYYSNAVIHSEVVKVATADEVNAYMAAQARAGAEDITLFCSAELYAQLMAGISRYSFTNEGAMAPVHDIACQAGLNKYTFSYSATTHIIEFHVESYYPGFRIVNAAVSGTTDALTDREAETLQAALRIVPECLSDDSLTTARNIHDRICQLTTYDKDDVNEEKDTAIGVLLNGCADCDGYADAFYLLGSLAGLNVRMQHGDSYSVGFDFDFLNSATHMWNLLEIDGSWRVVDATWDDSEEGNIRYTWFNLGRDRASRMHIWNESITVPLLENTDLNARPSNEYLISCAAEAEAAAADALSEGCSWFELIYADESAADRNEVLEAMRNQIKGSFQYAWNERMLTLTVYIG